LADVKDQKSALVAIAVIITMLAVNIVAIGNEHAALAQRGGFGRASAPGLMITEHLSNTGINVQTDTYQNQTCATTSGNSGISGSCTASSIDHVNENGGKSRR
jgi:hypothetical protein